jgi:hypothetical protein
VAQSFAFHAFQYWVSPAISLSRSAVSVLSAAASMACGLGLCAMAGVAAPADRNATIATAAAEDITL